MTTDDDQPTNRMTDEKAAALRKAFPASAIGKLPRATRQDAAPGNCGECGKWHKLPAIHLDYVGHAAVTARLLTVDPAWSWEPFSYDNMGLPAIDPRGNLWIRLTVCGVTRIGVGDGNSVKELIGDAIRNAAMRFGVALDLWTKEELEHGPGEAASPQVTGLPSSSGNRTDERPPPEPAPDPPPNTQAQDAAPKRDQPSTVSEAQVKKIQTVAGKLGLTREQRLAGYATVLGHPVASTNDLSWNEAKQVIDSLELAQAERVARKELETGENP
jgi:hypothetical protein